MAFVEGAGWPAASVTPLAADASTRSYYRLRDGERRAVLMDAPPGAEEAACPPHASREERKSLGYNAVARLAGPDSRTFAGLAVWLRDQGLGAPEVLKADFDQGFVLLEDLGDALFARIIEKGQPAAPLYEAAVDVLLSLHRTPPPQTLTATDGREWPLLDYDAVAFEAETEVFLDWYWPVAFGTPIDPVRRAAYDAAWAETLQGLSDAPRVVTLRDYHAENLIWMADRSGPRRVGLLDFQDALQGPAAYDLVSLLTDARRDVEPALGEAMKTRYLEGRSAQEPGFDRNAFLSDYAVLSIQRNTKILGIFARLHLRDGKPRYLSFIPRIWRYMQNDLRHPVLAPVAAWFAAHIPADKRADAFMPSPAPARG